MAGDSISTPSAEAPQDSRESAPAPDPAAADATIARLDDQIDWYGRRSTRCQRMYKWLKFIEIAAAAAIPLVAAFGAPVRVGAVLGTLIVLLAGVEHMNQYQSNWITYRSTCEALKHEKFLYLAGAGPYVTAHPHRVLAERIESQISREHSRWNTARKETAKSHTTDEP